MFKLKEHLFLGSFAASWNTPKWNYQILSKYNLSELVLATIWTIKHVTPGRVFDKCALANAADPTHMLGLVGFRLIMSLGPKPLTLDFVTEKMVAAGLVNSVCKANYTLSSRNISYIGENN